MKLIELLQVLPELLDITVEHNGVRTSSAVKVIKTFDNLTEREVLSAEPKYIHNIGILGIQSCDIKVK